MADKFDSVKTELNKILSDLDTAIATEVAKTDHKTIDLTTIKSVLNRIDAQIVGKAEVATAMIEGDSNTRAQIMQIIEDMSNDIKKKLDAFREIVTEKSKKTEIDKTYEDDVLESDTMSTYDQLRELEKENGAYSLGSIDKRISNAEKEQENAEKMISKKEQYDQLIAGGKNKDDLKTEITVEKDVFIEELKRLDDIKNFNFDEKMDTIVSLTHSRIPNKKELEKKCKELDTYLDLFADKSIKNALDIGTLDFSKPEEIRKRLEELRDNFNIEEQDEIANNEELQAKNLEKFKKFLDGTDTARLFTDETIRVEEIISDIDFSVTDKIKELEKYVRQNKKSIDRLDSAKKEDLEADKKVAGTKIIALQEEAKRQEVLANGKPVKKVIDHEAIDLTDFGLTPNEALDAPGNKYFDFAKDMTAKEREKYVDELYNRIRSSATAYEVTKRNFPVEIKKGNRIVDFFRKLFKKPTKEERERAVFIKAELAKRLGAQKDEIRTQEAENQSQYEVASQKYNNTWKLSVDQKEAYEKQARKLIVDNKGKKKAKEVKKEAEKNMFEEMSK